MRAEVKPAAEDLQEKKGGEHNQHKNRWDSKGNKHSDNNNHDRNSNQQRQRQQQPEQQ